MAAHEAPAAPPSSPESFAAAGTTTAADIVAAPSPEPELAVAANAEAAALDLEIAQDMAVLDAIALEMAEPDFHRGEQTDLAETASVEVGTIEPVTVEPVTVDAGAATLASAIAPEPEQPSLGETLIASGIFSVRNAANDALAPIRRMTQAERVAFFS